MRIAVVFVSLALAAGAQTFPIAGVVIDAGSRAPMNRVRITLAPSSRPADQSAVITGVDGKFSFGVPKGKFRIVAERHGLRQPFGQTGPATGFGVSIITGPDQDTSHLVFRWFAPGAISGRIIDERAEPVEDALVQLIRVSVAAGHKVRRTFGWARTNDLGEYRFGELLGGSYYLAVTGEPWYVARSQARVIGRPEDAPVEPARSYAPVYYPGANDAAGAKPLDLIPGAELTADFQLSTVTGVNVHIHCTHPKGQTAMISLLTDGAAGVDSYQRQEPLTGDERTITGVFPGHYMVLVEGRNGDTSSARKAIDVGASDVNVELTMEPAPAVSGKVAFKNPQRSPRHPVYVRLVDDSNNTAVARAIDSSGAFSFDNVRPGQRRVLISGSDGYFVDQVTAEGASIHGPVIDIAPGGSVHLNIVATDEIGTLKGFVMNGDRPVAGVLAVLAPRTDSGDPGQYRGFQTDSDGSFDYENVRAGDYVLFAVERLDLEYANPAAVRPYLASGKPVHIGAHTSMVENASLVPLVRQN